MAFQIIRNDITHVKADAIVNTANPQPVCGGGTDYAIYQAAGMDQLLAERQKIGPIARGQAAATPAFALQADYIIHTVGPSWKGGDQGEPDILHDCYANSLEMAEQLGCHSIAFPLISTGVYGFPESLALQIALSVIQPFVLEHDMDVTLVVFGRNAFHLSTQVAEQVREYVDSNYVREARIAEYAIDNKPRGSRRSNLPPDEELYRRFRRRRYEREEEEIRRSSAPAPECEDAESSVFDEEEISEPKCEPAFSKSAPTFSMGAPAPMAPNGKPGQWVFTPEATFQEKLFEIIDARGLTGPQVYKNYISKQVYSKIQADKDYHPNKYTAIALCLSLHLNLEETRDLIGRAGWALSQSSMPDLIVAACIINGEYNIVNIDIILFDYGCQALEKIK